MYDYNVSNILSCISYMFSMYDDKLTPPSSSLCSVSVGVGIYRRCLFCSSGYVGVTFVHRWNLAFLAGDQHYKNIALQYPDLLNGIWKLCVYISLFLISYLKIQFGKLIYSLIPSYVDPTN